MEVLIKQKDLRSGCVETIEATYHAINLKETHDLSTNSPTALGNNPGGCCESKQISSWRLR